MVRPCDTIQQPPTGSSNLNVFCRKKQKKVVELNAHDSSEDEGSDDDESIGNVEFPEYVSCMRLAMYHCNNIIVIELLLMFRAHHL